MNPSYCPYCKNALRSSSNFKFCPHCGKSLPTSKRSLSFGDEEVLNLLRQGRKIQAIKVYRNQTGYSLQEAKAAIEQMAQLHQINLSNPSRRLMVVAMAVVIILGAVVAFLTTFFANS